MMRSTSMFGAFITAIAILSVPTALHAQGGLVPCTGPDDCDFNALMQLGQNVLNWLVMIAIPLSTIAFAWAGFLYVTAAGDQGKIKQAHDIFRKVAIGLVLVLSSWLIVNLILTVLTDRGLDDFV